MIKKVLIVAASALALTACMPIKKSHAGDRGAEVALQIAGMIAGAIASRRGGDRYYYNNYYDPGYGPYDVYPAPAPIYPPPYPYYGYEPNGTYYRGEFGRGPLMYRGNGRYVERYDNGYRYRGHDAYRYDRTFDPRYRKHRRDD